MPKARVYSRYSRKSVALLGKMISFHRKERGLTAHDLADRAGISRTTLQKIEKGNMNCEIGIAFEVAALVGLKLFDADLTTLAGMEEGFDTKISLLPKRVRTSKVALDDDF